MRGSGDHGGAVSQLWHPVETAPKGEWLGTKREGEAGENVCFARELQNGDVEWLEKDTGRTTVTHHSFSPPTHWRFLVEEADI